MIEKSKKPIYKRWWFVLIALIILGSVARQSKNDSENITLANSESESSTELVTTIEAPETTEKVIDENIQAIMDSMLLNESEANVVFNDIISVGFSSISDIQKGAGTGVDELQSFVGLCDGIKTIVTIEKRKTYYIGVGIIDLYDASKGGVLDNIQDYVIDDTDRLSFMSYSEEYIKQILKAPSTAKFPGHIFESDKWSVNRYQDVITVVSYVDSQNSFGAMLRSEFAVQMSYSTGDVLYIVLDGKEVYGNRQPMKKE